MKLIARWAVAVLVTVAAFTIGTWVSGGLVLPHFFKDPVIRWGAATALGVALAALAALGGHSFATREKATEAPAAGEAAGAVPAMSGTGETHSEIRGGTFYRNVTMARDISKPDSRRSSAAARSDQDGEPVAAQTSGTGLGNTRSEIIDGIFHGDVTLARDISGLTSSVLPVVPPAPPA